ncbi:hypothetical protein [Streptomyces dysideae]|nr:hypothetical protein [Streptomyces dysideae]
MCEFLLDTGEADLLSLDFADTTRGDACVNPCFVQEQILLGVAARCRR